jgi:predicted aspartyl protease
VPRPQCLTVSGVGILHVIQTNCWIAQAFDPANEPQKPFEAFTAIWDTGATGTVVTQNVISRLGLKPIRMVEAHTAGGTKRTEVYLANVMLPNQVHFPNVHVARGEIVGADVLIGMEIITTGDFAITNQDGKTVCSFRWPSSTKIDFVVGTQTSSGRNDPCPCGSGKKYKHCCGNLAT